MPLDPSDPNAAITDRIMQHLNQGGVPITAPDGTAGFVPRDQVDQFLSQSPGYSKAVFITAPDGRPGTIAHDKAGDFLKQNPAYKVGLNQGQDLSTFDAFTQQPGVLPGLARAAKGVAVDFPKFLYHAATDEPKPEERVFTENNYTNPLGISLLGRVALAGQRVAIDPSVQAYQRGLDYEDAAQRETDPLQKAKLKDAAGAYKMAAHVPLLGPLAAGLATRATGDPLAKGTPAGEPDPWGALSEGVAYGLVPKAQETVTSALKTGLARTGVGDAIADRLRTTAERQMQQVLNPTTRENKAIAAKVAPEMLERGVKAVTRKGLEQKAAAKAEAAGQEIDQYYQSLPENAAVPTQPLLDHFEQGKQQFMGSNGEILDQKAIDRIDGLKQVVAQFGDQVPVDDLVKLRRLWDKQIAASKGFFGKTVEEGTLLDAKREAAASLRDALASNFPDVQKFNAEYSFWENVRKVVAETNLRQAGQATPLGEQVAAGAGIGGGLAHAGLRGALGWGAALPMLRKVFTSTAWRTVTANIRDSIANKLASGDLNGAVRQATRAVQQPLPFVSGPLFDVDQTPGQPTQQPPLALPPGQYEQPPSPLGPVFQQRQFQLGKGAEPPIIGPSRQLGPATPHQLPAIPEAAPESPINPNFPRIGRRQRGEQARGGPQGGGDLESRSLATAGEDEMEQLRRRGVPSSQAADQLEMAQNKVNSLRMQAERQQAAGESSYQTVSQLRAAEADLRDRTLQNVPGGTSGDLESRPLVAPPEKETQLDLGLNLPRRSEAFYSKAEQIADAKLPKSGPGDSMLATLRNNGVKVEEIGDLGLNEIAGKPKVSKAEVLDLIRNRRPQLEQTTLEGDETKYEDYTTPGGSNYREILTHYPKSEMGQLADKWTADADELQRQMDEEIDQHNAASAEEQANWPDDYFDNLRKEIRVTRNLAADAKMRAARTEFTTGHWTETPNVIGHTRESDFTTTDNMPVRHVQEWQSDLHQRGREQGYRQEPLRQLPEGYKTEKMSGGGYVIRDAQGRVASVGGSQEAAWFPGAQSPEDAIDAYIGKHNEATGNGRGAPNAPFKKSWHELAVKDSIRRAIADGKQGMTWDTGETQADRYDLAKQVERIEYDPHTETLNAFDHDGKRVIDENVKPEKLSDYIGKEAAGKLQDKIDDYHPSSEDDYSIHTDDENGGYAITDANGEEVDHADTPREARSYIQQMVESDQENNPLPTLRGLDLKVGGEGMGGFYDKIVPDYIRKYTKKWGAKVDTAELPTGETRTEHEYVGPDKTEDEVRQMWEQAAHRGPREWRQTKNGSWAWFEDGRQISGAFADRADREVGAKTISNSPFERDLRNVLDQVHRGIPFKDAMSAETSGLAAIFGGELKENQVPNTTTVHRLTFTPEMIRAIQEEGQPLYQRGKGAAPEAFDEHAAADAMSTRYQPRQGREAATVFIDQNARDVLAKISGSEGWEGVSWSPKQATERARQITQRAQALSQSGGSDKAVQNLLDLASHIQQAGRENQQGGVRVVFNPEQAGHEGTHVGQRALAGGAIEDHTDAEYAASHPLHQVVRQKLLAAGYADKPAVLVAETEAHILDGSHQELGLTAEQAAELMYHHYEALLRQHGEEGLRDAPELAQNYLDAMREMRDQHAETQSAARAPDTAAQAEVPEVSGNLPRPPTQAGQGKAGGVFPLLRQGQAAAAEPTSVGGRATVETAKTDNAQWAQAKQELGPNASIADINKRVFELRAKAAAAGGVQSRPIPKFLRQPEVKPTETPEFKRWFGNSKTVDDEGQPQVLYHGTTHTFDTFSPERSNIENHFGKGYYFSDDPHDVSTNYAGKGPDLTSRIETLADRLQSEDEKLTPSQAQQLAEEQLKGEGGHVMPTYVKMENPVEIKPKGGTRFDLNYDEETGEESGSALKLYQAVNDVANDFGDGQYAGDGQRLWGEVMENLRHGDFSDFTAHDFVNSLRNTLAEHAGAYTDEGEASGEFIRQVFQSAGFDGIKQDASSELGAGRKYGKPTAMAPGTSHYIAFEPNQIKSAIGNQGTFNPESSSILESRKLKRLTDEEKLARLNAVAPRDITEAVRPEELAGYKTEGSVEKAVEKMQRMPAFQEFLDLAERGAGERKWYQRSRQALSVLPDIMPRYFEGSDDVDRFTDVLASFSPRQAVKTNLVEALNFWKAYVDQGRPSAFDQVKFRGKTMSSVEALMRQKTRLSGTKVPNAMTAFRGEDLRSILKEKYFKVPSFTANLKGFLDRITSDGWMAAFADMDPKELKNPESYHPLAIMTRLAAKELGWEPAEAQAAIWSVVKTLTEKGESSPAAIREFSSDFADILKTHPDVIQILQEMGAQPDEVVRRINAAAEAKPEIAGRLGPTSERSVRELARRLQEQGRKPRLSRTERAEQQAQRQLLQRPGFQGIRPEAPPVRRAVPSFLRPGRSADLESRPLTPPAATAPRLIPKFLQGR